MSSKGRRWKLEDLGSKMQDELRKKIEWLASSRTYRKVSYDESQQPSERYDPDIIRDYLEQLKLELRWQYAIDAEFARILETSDYESLESPDIDEIIPQEVQDGLDEHIDKRKTWLLPEKQFDVENATPKEIVMALYGIFNASAVDTKLKIAALESLQSTFERSLQCVENYEEGEDGIRRSKTNPLQVRYIIDNIVNKPKDNKKEGPSENIGS